MGVGTKRRSPADGQHGTLAALRDLVPRRPLRYAEALRIAEQQAELLLRLAGLKEPPVPIELITSLPRLQVVAEDVPVSGSAHWDGKNWLIVLNMREHQPRRRFALAHEFKHIIDHTTRSFLYDAMPSMNPVEQAERAADYFAGCLLMPRRWLKKACATGEKTPQEVARLFGVPVPIAEARLTQCGLAPSKPGYRGLRMSLRMLLGGISRSRTRRTR